MLKAAAYISDNREKDRHLEDVALLSSLITDHRKELLRLHGSDLKRLKRVASVLADQNHAAWLKLSSGQRRAGQDTLRILSSL